MTQQIAARDHSREQDTKMDECAFRQRRAANPAVLPGFRKKNIKDVLN